MTREDYILRLISEMGRVWARFIELIKRRRLIDARALLEQAYPQLLGISLADAHALAAPDLLARLLISDVGAAGRDKCLVLVTLLTSSGDLTDAEGDPDGAADIYCKALDVLLHINLHMPAVFPDAAPTVADLLERLSMYDLPLDTSLQLLRYYEQEGAYASAEDVLFELLDRYPEQRALLELGADLYARLQQQSDERLAIGQLTRAELAAGLAELRRRAAADLS